MAGLETRESTPADLSAIDDLYPRAFPDEDLRPLVRALLNETSLTLSLVAVIGPSVVGHVIFAACHITGNDDTAALLGPLAVAPDRQGQGVGSTVVRAGLKRLEDADVAQVFVLGDPGYYKRFGFTPEARVATPYPLPAEWRGAWQSISLGAAEPPRRGTLGVPRAWRRPALWAP